jgi:hypothetical protein
MFESPSCRANPANHSPRALAGSLWLVEARPHRPMPDAGALGHRSTLVICSAIVQRLKMERLTHV